VRPESTDSSPTSLGCRYEAPPPSFVAPDEHGQEQHTSPTAAFGTATDLKRARGGPAATAVAADWRARSCRRRATMLAPPRRRPSRPEPTHSSSAKSKKQVFDFRARLSGRANLSSVVAQGALRERRTSKPGLSEGLRHKATASTSSEFAERRGAGTPFCIYFHPIGVACLEILPSDRFSHPATHVFQATHLLMGDSANHQYRIGSRARHGGFVQGHSGGGSAHPNKLVYNPKGEVLSHIAPPTVPRSRIICGTVGRRTFFKTVRISRQSQQMR